MSITNEKLQTIKDNVFKVYCSGQMDVIKNANSLKGFESNKAILLDDVSPVTHEMGVKVRSKNIFNYDGVAFIANFPNVSTFVKDNNTLKFTTTERMVYFATTDIESFKRENLWIVKKEF